jgi:hypothetical protein
MRRRRLKWLWGRLKELSTMNLNREQLLMKLGAARAKATAVWRLVDVEIAAEGANFSYKLNRKKLRRAFRREGRYLLRTNLTEHDPAKLWTYYLQLVSVEEAFKDLKGDLAIRPIFHQSMDGLLPVCHPRSAFACSCTGIDAAQCARKIRCHANDRRPPADR